jgi:hypothetical protein
MMTLTQSEYKFYLNTTFELFYYVAQRTKLIPASFSFSDFVTDTNNLSFQSRNKLLQNPSLLYDYITSTDGRLSDEELDLLEGYRKRISDQFFVYKHLSKHTIVRAWGSHQFYAIKSLGTPLSELIIDTPTVVNLVILPFNGQIVFDGFVERFGPIITIGPTMRKSFHAEYQAAKKNKQILMEL